MQLKKETNMVHACFKLVKFLRLTSRYKTSWNISARIRRGKRSSEKDTNNALVMW